MLLPTAQEAKPGPEAVCLAVAERREMVGMVKSVHGWRKAHQTWVLLGAAEHSPLSILRVCS